MKIQEVDLQTRIIGAIGCIAVGSLLAMTCLIERVVSVTGWIAFSVIIAGLIAVLLYLFPEARKEMKKKSFFITFTIPCSIMSIMMWTLWYFSY